MIKAFRMDGLGNKFIIVDRRENSVNISKEKIVHLGNLNSFHRDIGFDQLIFIEKEIDKAFPITIFNSDGNEISACGNGSRCIAYLLSKDLNTKKVRLKTNNRLLDATIVGNLDVEIAMGKPIFEWDEIPLSKKIDHKDITLSIDDKTFTNGFSLNVGNPHIIFFVEDCYEYDLRILGPKIENHELFPEKTNVTFAQIDNKNNISVNVWERGAGLTKACGTAACATAVAAAIKKIADNNINIKFKEGNLNIKIDKNLNIFMRGPVSDIKHTKLEI
ncbi:diaminopimelate epimerase [Candidatus Pelagibacter bacterium]|nr:diaminopimelate epimerase [Candidatus Pelagibacter bacterium]MDA9625025.1 diaminopimelate epimerase [Candidatus Pelagibacter bacterium]